MLLQFLLVSFSSELAVFYFFSMLCNFLPKIEYFETMVWREEREKKNKGEGEEQRGGRREERKRKNTFQVFAEYLCVGAQYLAMPFIILP